MPRPAKKTPQIFTVRCDGSFVATYRALTPEAAIQRHLDDQAVYFSTFRRHAPRSTPTYTASVEPTPPPLVRGNPKDGTMTNEMTLAQRTEEFLADLVDIARANACDPHPDGFIDCTNMTEEEFLADLRECASRRS